VVRRHRATVPGPQAEIDVGPEHVALVTALARLSDSQRQVVVLHHLADLGTAEIAHVLGVPEGTVKSRLARGRSLLAELLDESEAPRHA
jgi:RNA polymerase sigma-70 factor, ECF subfamily